jgi:hypothetical protein
VYVNARDNASFFQDMRAANIFLSTRPVDNEIVVRLLWNLPEDAEVSKVVFSEVKSQRDCQILGALAPSTLVHDVVVVVRLALELQLGEIMEYGGDRQSCQQASQSSSNL